MGPAFDCFAAAALGSSDLRRSRAMAPVCTVGEVRGKRFFFISFLLLFSAQGPWALARSDHIHLVGVRAGAEADHQFSTRSLRRLVPHRVSVQQSSQSLVAGATTAKHVGGHLQTRLRGGSGFFPDADMAVEPVVDLSKDGGVMKMTEQRGVGRELRNGDDVYVHVRGALACLDSGEASFEGTVISGVEFDSTQQGPAPHYPRLVRLGGEQTLKGLDLAIGTMVRLPISSPRV